MADKFDLSATTRATGEKTVFIDVGAKRIDARVSRDGIPLGVFQTDPAILDPIIVSRPLQRLRVVSQSIPAGTPVPVGTSVNLVLASPGDFPVGIVVGTHQVLKTLKMDTGHAQFIAGNTRVNRILSLAAAGPLSPEDKQAVVDIFAEHDVAVTEQPGHDVTAAVETLRVLSAFGGR